MFFKKYNNSAVKIYQNIVKRSRSKFFYVEYKLEDNFETRFDLIIYHAFIIFYFYKNKKINKSTLSQDLFDLMFEDFENNLREMGFGDIAVNKKMKVFITAFYGRIAQYNKGLDQYELYKDKTLIRQTILNNIYKSKIHDEKLLDSFVNFMLKSIKNFDQYNEERNIKDNFQFLSFQ